MNNDTHKRLEEEDTQQWMGTQEEHPTPDSQPVGLGVSQLLVQDTEQRHRQQQAAADAVREKERGVEIDAQMEAMDDEWWAGFPYASQVTPSLAFTTLIPLITLLPLTPHTQDLEENTDVEDNDNGCNIGSPVQLL
jgi:hypothetical protein